MHWIYSIENKIFTIVSYKGTEALQAKYPNIFFTQDNEPENPATIFPTIYINFKQGKELSKTLESNSIAAYICNIEVEITCNSAQKQNGARQIAWEILDIFNKLGFSALGTVRVVSTGNDTHKAVFNVTRVIGSCDKIG